MKDANARTRLIVTLPVEDDLDLLTDDDNEGQSIIVLTARQEAQLQRFGRAKPLVKALAKWIRLLAIVKNAYADITPRYSKADRQGNRVEIGTVLEKWVPEERVKVNHEMRPGKTPLKLLDAHIHYVSCSISILDSR